MRWVIAAYTNRAAADVAASAPPRVEVMAPTTPATSPSRNGAKSP